MAHLIAQGTSRERTLRAKSCCDCRTHAAASSASATRLARNIQRRRQVEPQLIRTYEIPVDARSISVSVDRVAVPMEEPLDEPKDDKPPKNLRAFRDAAPSATRNPVPENRATRMDYAGARARGFAIGSGAVEATCKSLVSIRIKRAGSRWTTETGNEVLALRALQLSDPWQQAVSGALKPLVKSVRVVSRPRASTRRLRAPRASRAVHAQRGHRAEP
jgi:hypothetical protein